MTQKNYDTGAVRDVAVAGSKASKFHARYDLLSPIALKRVAETYGEGAVKYGDHNWRQGMPFSDTLNHCLAHLSEYMRGDTSEDHLAHAAWNLFALMHFEETHPELNDIKVDDLVKSPHIPVSDMVPDCLCQINISSSDIRNLGTSK